jgi:hypothetical protein
VPPRGARHHPQGSSIPWGLAAKQAGPKHRSAAAKQAAGARQAPGSQAGPPRNAPQARSVTAQAVQNTRKAKTGRGNLPQTS